MMNEALCILGGLVTSYAGFITYLYKREKKEADRCLDIAEKNFKELDNKKFKLEGALYKATQENIELQEKVSDFAQLKADFQGLASDYEELKEKHAPFASLNPFEQQAVSAMTDQSVYNEWLNGAPKEVK